MSAEATAPAQQDVVQDPSLRADTSPEVPSSPSDAKEKLVPGQDYVAIPGGHPYVDGNDRVEVVEVFGYVCPACARFHPPVSAWVRTLPADVDFRYVPAPFGRDWDPYARGFYVADAMGLVLRTHDALINAIHVQHSMPGEGQSPPTRSSRSSTQALAWMSKAS